MLSSKIDYLEEEILPLGKQLPTLGRMTLFIFVLLSLAACQSETLLPTIASVAATVELPTETAEPAAQMPPTWTPEPVPPTNTPAPPPPTSTAVPTATQLPPTNTPIPPTNTPEPTATAVPPTNTAVPPTTIPPTSIPPTSPPAVPTVPTDPILGQNILPNPSFEEGHYNQDGIPELQLPNGWFFEWDEGPTGFGSNPWDVYVRPETRVLPASQLPPAEHPLFIWDGTHTVKLFKGNGAISLRLTTNISLEPGVYLFEINIFPDLVMGYENHQKIWADDPAAGEVRFIVTGAGTGWFYPAVGQKNTFTHTFTVTESQTIRVGVGLRGRYALSTNGFFVDDWSLKKIEG